MDTQNFYLGTHHPHWLRTSNVRLFVSRRALQRYREYPRASTPWALDSGGFSELTLNGAWALTAADYVAEVRRFSDEIGHLEFAAPQDWMCEPQMLKRTGLTVEEHQRRTVINYLDLMQRAPELPWVPVLQGWVSSDYLRHVDAYYNAGVDLSSLPRVGVGTVCRRQDTTIAALIMGRLHAEKLRLHAFGFKLRGLQAAGQFLVSADSLAWSYSARRNPPIKGHTHKNCANCIEYALNWRDSALASIQRSAA